MKRLKNLRSAVHLSEWIFVFNTWCVRIIAGLDFILEVIVYSTGIIADLELTNSRDTKKLVFVENIAKFIL